MKNLVSTWLEIELKNNGLTLAEAIREMNQALGSGHTHSRVHEWAECRNGRGTRLPQAVRSYLLYRVMKDVFKDVFGIEIDDRTRIRLVRMLQ